MTIERKRELEQKLRDLQTQPLAVGELDRIVRTFAEVLRDVLWEVGPTEHAEAVSNLTRRPE